MIFMGMLRIPLLTKLEKDINKMNTLSDREKALLVLHSRGFSYHRCGDYLNINFRQVRYMFEKMRKNKELRDYLL